MTVRFEKWQALGNDYVILESGSLPWELNAGRVRRICDPHFGVGSDGVLLLRRLDGDPEASPSCGSSTPTAPRPSCPATAPGRRCSTCTGTAGPRRRPSRSAPRPARSPRRSPRRARRRSRSGGRARSPTTIRKAGRRGRGTLTASGREWGFQHVSIGNPQCAIEVGAELEDLDLAAIGPEIERHELFPNRTNVSFTRTEGSRVRARIFERGVGETLSSGTGASGAAVAAFLRGAPSPITVELDGGELEVEISERARGAAQRLGRAGLRRRALRRSCSRRSADWL